MSTCKIILIIGIVFLLSSGGCCNKVKPVDSKNSITLPDCKALVKYSGSSLSVTGVEIPMPVPQTNLSPIKIGGVTWKPEVLNQASETVQILDNNRITICSYLPALASSGKLEQFHEELKQYMDEANRICQLAILIKLNNPEAVQKWITAYVDRATAIKEAQKAKEGVGMTSETQSMSSIKTYQEVYPITDFVK